MEGFEYDTSKGRFRAYLRSAVVHALSRRFSKEAREAAVIDPHNFDYLASEKEASADARWERDFQAAYAVRDELAAKGIVLEDTPEGTRWKVVRPG